LKTFYIDSVEDWELFAQEHDLEISQCIIEVALKNLDSRKRFHQLEAIEVEDEDTAIAVQKKSPDSDVRIVKK